MSISVIAGLGNPGIKYCNSRHNIGFAILDFLASQQHAKWKNEIRFKAKIVSIFLAGKKILLVKPQTYMNASGLSLYKVMSYLCFKPTSLAVIYDDITIESFRVKLTVDGGSGGHNGIADLLDKVGSGMARFRIGIGPKLDRDMDLADFVLGKFTKEEQETLESKMPLILDQIKLLVDKGADKAMNSINKPTQ